MDINSPLKTGVRVMFEGETMWLPIKYESLPIYCYGCGILGHSVKTCSSWFEPNLSDPEQFPFGPTFKAPLEKHTRLPKDGSKPAHMVPHSPAKSHSPTTSQTSIYSKLEGNKNLSLPVTYQNPPKESRPYKPFYGL